MTGSSGDTPRILIVEDDAGLADLEARRLHRAGMTSHVVHDLEQAREWLSTETPDLVLVDYRLPDGHAGQLLDWLGARGSQLPMVVVTGNGDEHIAVEMMKWGARDYLVKGSHTLAVLAGVVERVLSQERLRRELREAQERYQFIVDHTDDVISIHDLEGNWLFVSPPIERLTGYTIAEVTSRPLATYAHPDDAERLHAVRDQVRQGANQPFALEYRLPTRDGGWRWVETTARPISGADGRPTQIIATTRDITVRKAAEAQLRSYTALLEALAAFSEVTVSAGNIDDELARLLARMAEILHVDVACIHLQDGELLVPRAAHVRAGLDWQPLPLPVGKGFVGRIARSGEPLELHGAAINAMNAADGVRSVPFSSVLGLPLKGRSGILGVLTVCCEVQHTSTEESRRLLAIAVQRCALFLDNAQLQAHLAASEARHRELVESLPDVVCELDTQGHYTFVNQAMQQVLGYSPDELVGTSGLSLISADDRALTEQKLTNLFSGSGPVEVEAAVRHRDGHLVLMSIKGFVRRNIRGEAVAAIVVARDVTQQRRLEEQLRTSQRLEAIGRLAGGIAHDFNNLLTGILGSAQILQEQAPPEHPFQEDLDLIAGGAQRAANLTRQLLAFSRRQTMEMAPVSVGEIVQDMTRLIERTIGEHIAVSLDLAEDLPLCRADTGQLEQVLLNLCVNARDAMPGGGKLVISTALAEITPDVLEAMPWARPGRYVMLSVTDTGTGMDAQTQARIFEPYFSTKAASGRGTGLGLATVHGIVTQHGGFIHVYSEPGTGSSFKIYLPVTEAGAEPVPDQAAPPADRHRGQGLTVLVAEDEAPIRRLIDKVLSSRGYRVAQVDNGQDAIARFTEQPSAYAAVILDVVTPQGNVKETMSSIRSVRCDIPLLLMSGFAQEVLGEVPEHEHFLPKPFTRDQLLEKLESALAGGSAARNGRPTRREGE